MNPPAHLNFNEHRRDSSGMTYVYPVLSRRAGGVSIGINLNPNHACNWRCIYCQVEGLVRGAAPAIDLELLDAELRRMLSAILHGDYLTRHAAEQALQLRDIAFSGDGEPTSSAQFGAAIAIVADSLRDFGRLGEIKVRLITNGSLLNRPDVQQAVAALARCNGEVWFKVDAATSQGLWRINDVHLQPQMVLQRLRHSARLCPTWVQSCFFALDGAPPAEPELLAYLDLLRPVGGEIAGVHLYSLARPSMQPEAVRLTRLPEAWLAPLAERIRALGIPAHVSP